VFDRVANGATTDALAAELIRIRQARGSFAIIRAGMAVVLLGTPFILYILLRVNPRLGATLLTIAWSAGGYLLFLRWLYLRGAYRPWMDWANATLEISLLNAIVIVDARLVGAAYAFTTAPTLLIPIAIMASAVRLRRSLSVYTGALAALQYLALYLFYRSDIPPTMLEALPSLQPWNLLQRCCYFVLAGVSAFLVCQLMRRSVIELVTSVRKSLTVERELGRQVSSEVARLLVEGDPERIGEERELTVLFADIRGFTDFSERRKPSEVLEFLNAYFAVAADAIERHGGIVNKFTGDGLMALFGALGDSDDHALRAARAGRSMLDGLARLDSGSRGGSLRGRFGVGIHTGRAVLGILGTESRAEYTAIGDTVNVAARIEQLNKELETDLLVSDATARQLSATATLVPIGKVDIRGREEPLVVHQLTAVP